VEVCLGLGASHHLWALRFTLPPGRLPPTHLVCYIVHFPFSGSGCISPWGSLPLYRQPKEVRNPSSTPSSLPVVCTQRQHFAPQVSGSCHSDFKVSQLRNMMQNSSNSAQRHESPGKHPAWLQVARPTLRFLSN